MENILTPQKGIILDIIEQTEIEWRFRVQTDIKAECGQFLQVSLPKVGEMPISVADYDKNEGWIEFLIRKVGKVSSYVFDLKKGDSFFLRGPYGVGFPVDKLLHKDVIVVSGGSGLAPVRPLIKQLIAEQSEKTTLIMGFKDPDAILFKKDIEAWQKTKANVILTVDKNGNPKENINEGLVTAYVEKALENKSLKDLQIVIVGPPMMMHFACLEFLKHSISEEQIWVSYERNMSCGVGKCGHCKMDDTYICLEGPVFNYSRAKTLVD
ncbi:MAG: anaerobic sulfite reductase subunit AsrB [Brevinema sp.]